MEPIIQDRGSNKYGKVFSRGRIVDFAPEILNDFLGTPNVVVEDEPNDFDAIALFLTGGKFTTWVDRLPSSRLTSFYGFLHKVYTYNWATSNNHSIITTAHAKLLYQTGVGLEFNLGQLIFDEVTFFAVSLAAMWSLPFPSLIC